MTPRQPINRKPSSGKHVPPPVTLPQAPWAQEGDETDSDRDAETKQPATGSLRERQT